MSAAPLDPPNSSHAIACPRLPTHTHCVGVVLQVIFGSAVPFVGGDIVGNLTNLIGSLGEGGLVGLISIGIILYLIQRA